MYFKGRQRRSSCRGLSLVELLCAMVLATMLLGAMAAFSLYSSRSLAVFYNWGEMDQKNRLAINQMTRDFRQANRVTVFGTNYLVFEEVDGKSLTYTFDAAGSTLSRAKQGQAAQVLLTGCEELVFTMLQRNLIEGSFDLYPTDNPIECKVVGVSWQCSRSLLSGKANISSRQAVRIVIRKQ